MDNTKTKTTLLPRTCRECGCTFKGGPRAWYCPKCRDERQKEADRKFKARKRAGDVIPIGSIIKCKECGSDIIKNSGSQLYCEKCAEKHLKEVDNAQSLEWKRNNPERYKQSKREFGRKRSESEKSQKSGMTGVAWDKVKHLWCATINLDGKQHILIRTKDKDTAINARQDAQAIKESGKLTQNTIDEIKCKYRKKAGT